MTTYERTPALAAYIDGALENSQIEAEMVRKLIAACAEAGTPIKSFYDGEERGKFTSDDPLEILDVVFNLDEVYLYTTDDRMVFIVFGNDPDELFCDYSVSLEDLITPICDWATEQMQ